MRLHQIIFCDSLYFSFSTPKEHGNRSMVTFPSSTKDSNNIYDRIGDLTIAPPSINKILLKTNVGYWETIHLNPYGVSINTLLYVT